MFEEPARWVLNRLEDMGIGVRIDPEVDGDISADAPNRLLLLSPNLLRDWRRAHYRLCRGTLYLEGGPDWAPEFEPPRVTGRGYGGVVVPFPALRRPW